MLKRILLLFLCVPAMGAPLQSGQAPQAQPQTPPPRVITGFIAPPEANVRIAPDIRTFVVMAALNMAGFDFETSEQALSPARVEIRKDLANLDPQVKAKLAAFYTSHKLKGQDETADAARYAALSMMMTEPPA